MTQEQQNLQSTKHLSPTVSQEFLPTPEIPNIHSHNVMSTLISFSANTLSYIWLHPFKTCRGNQYVYVLYNYDSNAILVEPTKPCQAQEIATMWSKLYERLTKHGHATSHFILDNECSTDLKYSFKKYAIIYQLAPPCIHCHNAAERAIHTFKSHFLSGLATCDPDFPISEWDTSTSG